jgi:hypothetical protein
MERDPRLALFLSIPTGTEGILGERFDRTSIEIATDADHILLALSVANLVARLWPNTEVVGLDLVIPESVLGSGRLSDAAPRLVKSVRLSEPGEIDRTIRVTLGTGPTADLYATANEWSIRAGRQSVESLGGHRGPATLAAASLIAAELFRLTIPELPGVRLDQTIEWNLVDYRLSIAKPQFQSREVEVTCFGCGSVGSSALLALLTAGASGSVIFVDDDLLQSHNRLRYPLWIERASGPKVDWLRGVAHGSRLRVEGHRQTAAEYGADLELAPTLAVAAVDTVAGRAQVADVLARETLNAGVDGLQLHVARHRFADGLACVYCGYVDASPAASEVDVYVGLTGLPHGRVKRLLGGERLAKEDVRTIANAVGIESGGLDDLVDGRLVDVARLRLYGAARIASLSDIAVVAPFVSAMAGAILAAEIMKPSMAGLDRRVDLDLSGWPTGYTSRPVQDPTGRCLCWSAPRKRRYGSDWNQQGAD